MVTENDRSFLQSPKKASVRVLMALFALILLPACTTVDGDRDRARNVAEINTQLAIGYMEQGELERALERLETALRHDPDMVDAHLTSAHIYTTIGQTSKAESHYQRAYRLKPDNANVLNNYATFLCSIERYDEAIEKFSLAANSPFYRTPEAALANAGVCAHRAGMNEVAEEYLRQAIDRAPTFGDALITLAEIYFERQDYFRARAFVQRFQEVGRITPDFLLLGYRVEDRLGNPRDRDAFRERLINDFPDSSQARRLMRGDEPSD